MAVLKLVVGLLSGSLGMLSDAAHSGIDLAGATLTLLSVRVSDKPADEDHPYGHAKIESISAFIETFLMLASAVWITAEAIIRIFFKPDRAALQLLAAARAGHFHDRGLLALASSEGRGHAPPERSARRRRLPLRLRHLGQRRRLHRLRRRLDRLGPEHPMAALRRLGGRHRGLRPHLLLRLRLAWRTVGALTDSVSPETRRRVLRELQRTDGVLAVDQARMRHAGAKYFADFTLSLSRHLTFQKVEDLVREATSAVHRVLPDADVVIHTVPRSTLAESIFDQIRAVASRNNVTLHDISVQSIGGRLRVEQHIEVNENLSLQQAHSFVRRIEDEIRQDLPQVAEVLTHIENEPATIESPQILERNRHVEARLRRAAAEFPAILDIHEVVTGRVGDKLQVSCHCTLPDDMPMQQVHEIITGLEDHLKLKAPEISRVLIHPEPATDNRH